MTTDEFREAETKKRELAADSVAEGVDVAAPPDSFQAFVSRTEQRLRVPNGFLFGLMKEPSDWAFCVQLHAVLESAINAVLHRAIREPRLDKEIALLPIRTKLKMVEAIDLLKGEFVGIVDSLGTLRNRIAHQVANIPGFTLQGYFANLDKGVQTKLTGQEPFPPDDLRMRIFVRALGVLVTLDLGQAEMDQRFYDELQTAIRTHNKMLSDAIAGLLNAGAGEQAALPAPPASDETN